METLAVFQLFVYAHHPHPFFNFLSFFNLCSVVIAVSGKINFTALLCGAEVAMTDDPATRL